MICTTTRALLRVNLRGAFSVCIKRMMGGRVIEENIDFYRYPICQCMRSLIVKIKKHSNQFTMPLLFCVILFYIIFLPLYFPLSEFINTGGTIYNTRETIRENEILYVGLQGLHDYQQNFWTNIVSIPHILLIRN